MSYRFLAILILLFACYTGNSQNIEELLIKNRRLTNKRDSLNQELKKVEDTLAVVGEKIKAESYLSGEQLGKTYRVFLAKGTPIKETPDAYFNKRITDKNDTVIIVRLLRSMVGFLFAQTASGEFIHELFLQGDEDFENYKKAFKIKITMDTEVAKANGNKDQLQADKNHHSQLVKKYGNKYGGQIAKGIISIGMTTEMVYESWGPPKDKNRTTTLYSTHEQWIYLSVYVYFDDNKCTGWQE